jgi:head-tail adaptor
MRAGRLDRLITIQRKTYTESPSGEPLESWSTIVARRPASIWTPQSGQESFSEPQMVAREKVEWLVRWSNDVADLSPLDRLVYPALADESPDDVPDERNIYDVIAVHEYKRREGLRIVTARRADVVP